LNRKEGRDKKKVQSRRRLHIPSSQIARGFAPSPVPVSGRLVRSAARGRPSAAGVGRRPRGLRGFPLHLLPKSSRGRGCCFCPVLLSSRPRPRGSGRSSVKLSSTSVPTSAPSGRAHKDGSFSHPSPGSRWLRLLSKKSVSSTIFNSMHLQGSNRRSPTLKVNSALSYSENKPDQPWDEQANSDMSAEVVDEKVDVDIPPQEEVSIPKKRAAKIHDFCLGIPFAIAAVLFWKHFQTYSLISNNKH
ncbi:hypothetical protein Taro_054775, partial [Colocasia esculenta]|nr:hypothetical protein [Colocasia esculenta]